MGCVGSKPQLANGNAGAGAKKQAPKVVPKKSVNTTKNEQFKSNVEETVDFLRGVPIFLGMQTDAVLTDAAEYMKPLSFDSGDYIFEEGDPGDAFYILSEGLVTVSKDKNGTEDIIATLRTGDYFGEGAILNSLDGEDQPRNASIKCISATCTVLKMTKADFKKTNLVDKVNFPRRAAVGYHAIMDEGEEDPSFTKDTTKSSEERAMTMEAMRACLGSISDLNEAELESAVDKAWRMETKPGQRIIEQGNIIASRFYIIVRGHFMVTIDKEDGGAGGGVSEDKMMAGAANFRNSVHMNSDKSGGPRFQAMLDKGQYFGELALLHRAPRAANVHCHSEDGGCLFVVDRVTFQAILGDRARAITEQYKALVRQCKHDNGQYIFLNLTDEECVEAANIMVDRQFDKGDFICRQGESGHEFYIVREGTLNVKRIDPSNGHVAFEKTLKAGDCFGERALLDDDDKRKATVVVTSNFASILTIDRQTFENFLAPLSELKKPADDFQKQAGKRKSRTRKSTIGAGAIIANTMPTMKPSISPLRPDAFKIKGSLGTGAFGSVTLRTHLNTKQDFAIKQLSKAHIVKHKLVEKVKSEKDILKLTASPFIVQLFGTYRDADSIYFVLEAAMGGELYATYNRKGHFGKEPMARFFAACVTMAFVHLHERKIAYRDLKPENVLITKRGYGKVTDMGLATLVLGRTFTLCGTPEYFAPEIITAAGHNWNVD